MRDLLFIATAISFFALAALLTSACARIVWGPQYEKETNCLRVYLAQIRRKLEPDPAKPRYFVTEPGVGYRLEP